MGWCYPPPIPEYYQTHEKLLLHLAMNPTSTVIANLLTTLIIAWGYLGGGFLFVCFVGGSRAHLPPFQPQAPKDRKQVVSTKMQEQYPLAGLSTMFAV